jgi:LPS-assembly protein
MGDPGNGTASIARRRFNTGIRVVDHHSHALQGIILAAIAIMASGAAPQPAPPSPRQILLQADQITYDTQKGLVTAQGHVEISDEQRTLLADQVTYDENADRVTASGHVSLQDETGNVAFADQVELTRDLREGALQGFAALLGQKGRLAANSAERKEGRFTIANGAVYTPCEICRETGEQPTWEIRAARVVHDQLEKKVYFEDASLEFLGVPVL